MAKQFGHKLKILYILDILKAYSDEQNPLSAADICGFLEKKGITAERKSVYNDISMLYEYGCDIIKTSKGWFLGSREFEEPEIYLLTDAVRAAKFITAAKTRELISKLDSLMSEKKAEKREKHVYFAPDTKCGNEEIYYNIDKISRAVETVKKIKLQYIFRELSSDRTINQSVRERVISPYALTWQDDHYYMIGNYEKYDNLIHMRVDRMRSVEILNEKARPFSQVSEYKDFFDVPDYTNKLFSMHGGELAEIELCCNKKIMEQVADRFSENVFIKNVTEDEFSFSVKAAISEALCTWIINYGKNITVKAPQKLREMVCERAKQVLELYENKEIF